VSQVHAEETCRSKHDRFAARIWDEAIDVTPKPSAGCRKGTERAKPGVLDIEPAKCEKAGKPADRLDHSQTEDRFGTEDGRDQTHDDSEHRSRVPCGRTRTGLPGLTCGAQAAI
jgi:hypothetical protein